MIDRFQQQEGQSDFGFVLSIVFWILSGEVFFDVWRNRNKKYDIDKEVREAYAKDMEQAYQKSKANL